jgi:DNA recombination protein RmuC
VGGKFLVKNYTVWSKGFVQKEKENFVILSCMTPTILIALFGTIITILLVIILVRSNAPKKADEEDRDFLILQDQLNRLTQTMDERMHRSSSEINQALRHQGTDTQRLIADITRELTEVKESNKQVFSITEQLQNLEKVLKHQKQRGNLGEAQLGLILDNILPAGAYQMQYQFKNGEVVDAIIRTKDGIIPIDSKFSLDNYNRIVNEKDELERDRLENEFRKDLKLRIDETAKYIRPEEGTLPFAFMFIPAEGIYYDLLVNEIGAVKVNTRSLIDYAYKDKSVIIVSPTTFYAYLHSVLHGFRAFKIEESAKGIQKRVEELAKHLAAYEDYMRKLGATLGTTVNHYNVAYKELKKVDKDVLKISGETANIEPVVLDKPVMEEE